MISSIKLLRKSGLDAAARNGSSLIELLIVVAVSSILFGVLATTLVAMYRISNSVQTSLDLPWGSSQLVENLRQDIAEANVVSWNAETQELSIMLIESPNGKSSSVIYQFKNSHCTRNFEERNEQESRQLFKLPTPAFPTVTPKIASLNSVVSITLEPTEPSKNTPRYQAANRLDVLVGRSHFPQIAREGE